MSKALAVLDAESRALLLAIAWLLLAQALAAFAWQAGLLTRPAALLHWMVVGVLPAALALWSLPPADPSRR